MDDVVVNTKALDSLLLALQDSKVTGRLGVLAGKTQRQSDQVTNATIGAAHEYGTSKLPMRSFLRMPLAEMLPKKVQSAGLLDEEVILQVILRQSTLPWLKLVMVQAEACVLEAFDTGGFGKWPESDMTNKKNHQTLVETQQLRNSITWDVKGGK